MRSDRSTTLDEKLWAEALVDARQGSHQEIQRLEHEIKAEKRTQDNIIASLGTLTHETMVQRAQAQYEAAEQRIFTLEEQLRDLRSQRHQQLSFIKARPALQRLIEHWERVPREEKRNIFQDFAREITMTQLDKACKQVTIHWRDGSTSSQVIERITGRSRMYNDPETQYLIAMIEADIDQVDILRTFPDRSWASLQKRYARYSGVGHWRYEYAGERPYSKKTRWNDLSETEQARWGDKRQHELEPRFLSSTLWRHRAITSSQITSWGDFMLYENTTFLPLCA